MKEYLAQIVQTAAEPLHGRHLVREYLQARILGSLQRSGAMAPLAFHGGTSLRFLYQIPRYSEDLDFALEQAPERYDFRAYLKAIQATFTAESYLVELQVNDRRVVHSAFVRFPGLLHELKLSPHPTEVFSIKLEIDTNPPRGAVLETTIVRRYEIVHLQHHDRASLLAGKLHAILQRPYAKGRDLYDLLWYLSSPAWPAPNLTLLNNALQQTGWNGDRITVENWREIVKQRLSQLDWETAVAEARPFMVETGSASLLTSENVFRLLASP